VLGAAAFERFFFEQPRFHFVNGGGESGRPSPVVAMVRMTGRSLR